MAKKRKQSTHSRQPKFGFDPEYCRGMAMVLQGESLMAGSRVMHGGSLGGLREEMLNRFVHDATPGRYTVETGNIVNRNNELSPQCDLLVHEQVRNPPVYRMGHFVIVMEENARAVIEVKSQFKSDKWEELITNHAAIQKLATSPTNPVIIYWTY